MIRAVESRCDVDLARDAREGNLAFFVGSAVSILPPSNLPTFNGMKTEIVRSILRRAGDRAGRESSGDFDGVAPEVVYSCISSVVDRRFLETHQVFNVQNAGAHINANHRLLARLLLDSRSSRVLFTTNFDELIEAALEDEGATPGRDFIAYHDDRGFGDFAERYERGDRQAVSIVKLHGTISRPANLATLLQEAVAGLSAAQSRALGPVLRDRKLLVLGYSGNDSDVFPRLIGSDPDLLKGFYWCFKGSESYNLKLLSRTFGNRVCAINRDLTEILVGLAGNLEIRAVAVDQFCTAPSPRSHGYDGWAKRIEEWEALEILAQLRLVLREPSRARELFGRALDLCKLEDHKDARGLIRLLCSLGMLADGPQRLRCLEEAYALASMSGDVQSGRHVLRQVAQVHCDHGAPNEAIAILEETFEFPIDFILHGHLQRQKRNFVAAEASYRRAQQMISFEDGEESVGFANICGVLGVFYQGRDHIESVELLRRSFRIYVGLGVLSGASLAARNLAVSHMSKGDDAEADAHLHRAFDLAARIMDVTGMVAVADVYDRAARFEEAILCYAQIRNLVSALGARKVSRYADWFEHTGGIHWGQHDVDTPTLEEGITLGNGELVRAFCENKIGEIHGNSGRLLEARRHFLVAEDTVSALPPGAGIVLRRAIARNVSRLRTMLST